MRTFDNLIGNTEAYVNGVDMGAPFGRLRKVARSGCPPQKLHSTGRIGWGS